MKTTIIGAGKMGTWLAQHLATRGHPTTITDIDPQKARRAAQATGARTAETTPQAVRDADAAIICVPIHNTPDAIHEAAKAMKKGSTLAEISSIKHATIPPLRRAAQRGIKPLSIHPLFGPTAQDTDERPIALIPIVDREAEERTARRLFEGAQIIVTEQEEHDRAMAIALSLTYTINIALAGTLAEEDLQTLRRLAGTSFTIQLALAQGIISEDPGLAHALIRENPYTHEYIERFTNQTRKITKAITQNPESFNELYESIATKMEQDPDYQNADKRRYRAYKALKAP